MLHSFKVKNYKSILEEQELIFTSSKKYDDSVSESKATDEYVNNISLLIGGNGSGKTAILNALTCFFMFMQELGGERLRENSRIVDKHKLALKEPTNFELIFEKNKKLYKLELVIDGKNEVEKEALYVKNSSRFSYIYKIFKNQPIDINPKQNMSSFIKSKLNDEFEYIREKQARTSFLSNLIRLEVSEKLLGINKIADIFASNIAPMHLVESDKINRVIDCSEILKKDDELLKDVTYYLKKLDLEITDISFNNAVTYLIEDESRRIEVLNFVHEYGKKKINVDFLSESEGTTMFIDKLIMFLQTLQMGGVIIIDEIDNSLHPKLLRNLIELFADKELNQKDAQLIFTTHQPILLDDRSKTQIYLAEKRNLQTEIFRLDEIKGVSNAENFFKKYMSGEYGGYQEIGVF